MKGYLNDGCPNCDPDHAPTTKAAREWLVDDCFGKGHYHSWVERDFQETAEMLVKVEREAAQQERERLKRLCSMGADCTCPISYALRYPDDEP